ncbi:EamA-like transporter family protein [Moorella thermoacetica]|uniref:EamA-like transporter family protein n=1 Tax=Neomoorella thermoacetica TaxID=1525 RepID=A0A1J5JWE7_NEOTH|nr:EamA family transporter [Moorella thermoacetica]OIQ08887.1 EamA-like transporter family protein [Moorella thermoacetica]
MKKAKDSSGEGRGLFLAVLAAAALGLEGISAKLAYAGGANILSILAIRFLAAGILFWGSLIVFPLDWKLNLGTMVRLTVLALGGQATTILLLFHAFERIPATVAMLFFYLYPVIVSLLATVFLKETLTRAKIGALVLAFTGLAVILGVPTGNLEIWGIVTALLAACTNGIYMVGQTGLLKTIEPRVFNAYATLTIGVAYFILAIVTGTFSLAFNSQAILAIATLSLICTLLAYTAVAWSLKYIGASRAAIISTLEPVVTAVLGFLILGERLHPIQLLGGALILAGVTVQQVLTSKDGSEGHSYGIIKQ